MPRAVLPFALLLLLSGCASAPSTAGVSIAATGFKGLGDLTGVVRVPTNLLPLATAWRLLGLGSESVLGDTRVALTDPQDRYYRTNGHVIEVETDLTGTYRFQSGVPKHIALIVNATLSTTRHLEGLAVVPETGNIKLDLSSAGTLTTEFLRQQAGLDDRALDSYDATQVAGLGTQTQAALQAGQLEVPDFEDANLVVRNRAFALTVGTTQDLGDAWAALLGHRVRVIQTVAGDGSAGRGGDGGPALAGELNAPMGVVADVEGDLFVADAGNHEVRRIDGHTGRISTVAGTGLAGFAGDGGPAVQARLNTPTSLALDPTGNLYVIDAGNLRVRRIDLQTQVITTVVGSPAPDGAGGWSSEYAGDGGSALLARLVQPRAIAIDGGGSLFLTDGGGATSNHLVRRVDAGTGLIQTVVGLPGQLGAFDGDGGPPAKARLNDPHQLAFDAQGRLLIADTGNQCVRRVDFAGGTVTTLVGVGGQSGDDPDGLPAARTRLRAPTGLAVAANGRIFIVESTNGHVVTVGPDGTVKTLAGAGTGSGDNDTRLVALDQPQTPWIEATGNVVFAEAHGARLRRLVTRLGF